jgi:hypothetical protein
MSPWIPALSPEQFLESVMSYDLTNGNVNLNYTFNVSPMWGHCFPTGINALDGLTGEQAVPLMRHMRKRMEEDREYLLSIEPENGWAIIRVLMTS